MAQQLDLEVAMWHYATRSRVTTKNAGYSRVFLSRVYKKRGYS